jgi:hypothetical protein
MRRLVLTIAVSATLVVSAFGGAFVWGSFTEQAADGAETILWGT